LAELFLPREFASRVEFDYPGGPFYLLGLRLGDRDLPDGEKAVVVDRGFDVVQRRVARTLVGAVPPNRRRSVLSPVVRAGGDSRRRQRAHARTADPPHERPSAVVSIHVSFRNRSREKSYRT
jgi:hypothetical protein